MSGRFTAQEWSVITGALLLAAMSVIADARGGMRATVRHDAPAALQRAMDVFARAASAAERAEYRRFVLALAEAAGHAPRRGGLLRRGRATQTDAERDALRSITAIHDR